MGHDSYGNRKFLSNGSLSHLPLKPQVITLWFMEIAKLQLWSSNEMVGVVTRRTVLKGHRIRKIASCGHGEIKYHHHDTSFKPRTSDIMWNHSFNPAEHGESSHCLCVPNTKHALYLGRVAGSETNHTVSLLAFNEHPYMYLDTVSEKMLSKVESPVVAGECLLFTCSADGKRRQQ